MDKRLTPANGRVAAERLRGQIQADRFVEGEARRVAVPVADLDGGPGGLRDRQLLWGEAVTVFEVRDGFAFVEAARDGYVGYVAEVSLSEPRTPTHRVCVPATHLYRNDDMKSPDLRHLSFGALVTVESEARRFWETPEGYIPKPHLRPLDKPFSDPCSRGPTPFRSAVSLGRQLGAGDRLLRAGAGLATGLRRQLPRRQ
jgi:hypothetical protein